MVKNKSLTVLFFSYSTLTARTTNRSKFIKKWTCYVRKKVYWSFRATVISIASKKNIKLYEIKPNNPVSNL